MNVLFITIAWPPPYERNLYSDLMDEFAVNGHNVYVVSASELEMKEDVISSADNGIKIFHINSGRIRKTSNLKKSTSLLTLGSKIFRAIDSHLSGIRFNLIIGHTPPITLSSLYRKLKRRYNAPFYLLLKDIWPQGSVDHKVFRKYGLPWLYLRGHEINIYKTADWIGCMSPLGVQYLLLKNKFLESRKLEVCPNSIRPTEGFPEIDHAFIRQKYGIPPDACVFLFSGNLSKGHGLTFLIEAVRKLSDYPGAYFLIGGSGTHYKFIEYALRDYQGLNAMIYSRLPSDDFRSLMQTIDVGLILLDKCYTVPQFPSRLLTYLDFSKPVLCAINAETDIGTIVEENKCGKTLIHGDLDAFIEAVRFYSENEKDRLVMGLNSRKLLEKEFTTARCYNTIMKRLTAVD